LRKLSLLLGLDALPPPRFLVLNRAGESPSDAIMWCMPSRLALTFLFLAWTPGAAQAQAAVPTHPAGSPPPACDASHRGALTVELGGTGQPDLLKVCLKDGSGRFSWVNASQQNPNTFANVRTFGGCPMFPDNNVWNARIDTLPVAPESAAILGTYGSVKLGTVPDFALNLADAKTPAYPVTFSSAEVDGGKYPIAPDMQVEGYGGSHGSFPVSAGPYKGDSHLLVLRTDECRLYEIFAIGSRTPPFKGYSGAIFDMTSNDLRPDGWTSSDAAGLPIWPGVLTYAELHGEGEIRHMVRFTVDRTRNTFVWPARHYASRSADPALPPMGSRWRLKASFDENACHENEHSGQPFPPEMRRLIHTLKHYGMILADNGLAIKITTDSDHRWGDSDSPDSANWSINGWCHCMTGRDFEVVNSQPLMLRPDSGAVAQ
jgi:hypothetical protein